MNIPKGFQDMIITVMRDALGGLDLQAAMTTCVEEYKQMKGTLARIEQNQDEILQYIRAQKELADDHGNGREHRLNGTGHG